MVTISMRLNEREESPEVLVEVAESDLDRKSAEEDIGFERTGLSDRFATFSEQVAGLAVQSFDRSLDAIPLVADAVVGKVANLKRQPSEVEIAVGFKFTGKGDLKVVSGNAESHLLVTIKWCNADGNP